jgi:hypothetical protein
MGAAQMGPIFANTCLARGLQRKVDDAGRTPRRLLATNLSGDEDDMGAATLWVADREISVDVPPTYVPRSTLLPPAPHTMPSSGTVPVAAPAPDFSVDSFGRPMVMEMDWSDHVHDVANDEDGIRPTLDRGEDVRDDGLRPTMPSAR